MKSLTALTNLFTSLSLNSTPANNSLATILINDQHRYLLLKYFDNERSFTMLTVGPQTLTASSASLPAGTTSATLTAPWPNLTCQQLVVFSSGEQRTVFFTQNSTAIYWQSGLTSNQTSANLSCQGVQSYPLPANVSKIKNSTITIGQLVYSPAPVQSVQEWTRLNALPYASSIPAYFFIYNNQINFWPIPATSGEIITLNCQLNVVDMSYQDYTTGTISSASVGSTAIVGSGTTWTSYPQGTDLTFTNLYMTIQPPGGDGIAYPIQYFTSGTAVTLVKPIVNAPNASGANYVIGQYPLLDPNFHDAIVYGALRIYFNSIVKDPNKYQMFNSLFEEKLQLAEFYLSTKQVNVDLSVTPVQSNPNLYIYPTSN
jgi:hypothetical protein